MDKILARQSGSAALMSSLPARADAALDWISRSRDRLRLVGLGAALLLFAGGLYWALSGIGDIWSQLHIAPILVLVVIGAPVGVALNSVELCAISRIAGARIAWRRAVEITVLTSAANMLPLPGGALARIAALRAHGVAYRRGSVMLVMSYAIWGALAFLYSSVALILLGQTKLGILFGVAAALLLAICIVGLARYAAWKMVGIVALTRLVSFPLETVRYMLAIASVGSAVAFLQASVFVVASFIGSAVMLAPSGLGIGESVVALISPAASLQPAVGFVAAAIGRIVWMAGLIVMSACVLIRVRHQPHKADATLTCSA